MSKRKWFTVVEDSNVPANFLGILQDATGAKFRGSSCVSGCHHWQVADGRVEVPDKLIFDYGVSVYHRFDISEDEVLKNLVKAAH